MASWRARVIFILRHGKAAMRLRDFASFSTAYGTANAIFNVGRSPLFMLTSSCLADQKEFNV